MTQGMTLGERAEPRKKSSYNLKGLIHHVHQVVRRKRFGPGVFRFREGPDKGWCFHRNSRCYLRDLDLLHLK
ncbi:unnamed protein product [Pocillopora meandrina]|uniref:Uncharacterized protein n=1 Tax=Pocillopora meandrina TaxID=46732 RepID=A0AAU9WMI4_9CNID|nr:unnamed protein product [Pocillopora meandrina]